MFATLTFDQLYQNWVNQWASDMSTPDRPVLPNLPLGNMARAIGRANANTATTLQFQAVVVTNYARAQTSTGADLDSFYAQFGFPRLLAQYGNGSATFSAIAVLLQPSFIPVGTLVQSAGGAIVYQVIADPTNPQFIQASNSYQIPVGQQSVTVAIRATIPGASFNVQAGQLNQYQGSIYGVVSVTNQKAITAGSNSETDAAYRARFINYINGLSKATESALEEAIDTIQTGIKRKLLENVLAIGNTPTVMTITGAATSGDVVRLYVYNSGLPDPGSVVIDYTVQSGDTTGAMAAGIAQLVNANSDLEGNQITATANGNQAIMTTFSSNLTSYDTAVIGSGTEFTALELGATRCIGLVPASSNPIAYGNIVALIDDGSGNPSPELLATGGQVVDATRAYGIRYQVMAPGIISPPIAINVRLVPGANAASITSDIALQIQKYVNALAIGGDVDDGSDQGYIYLGTIPQQAFLAAGTSMVSWEPGSVLIDGQPADFFMQPYEEAILALTDIVVGTF